MIALLAAAMLQAPAAGQPPQIVVQGVGEVRIKPDVGTLMYAVHGEGSTSDDAVTALKATVTRVEGALARIDEQIAPVSRTFRVVIIRGDQCKEERYDDELKLSVGKCAIVGYIAQQSFLARTSRVDDIGTMISAISRAGAVDPHFTDFGLQDRSSGRAAAIADATQDAKKKAEAIAAANGVTLGPVTDIELDNARDNQEAITVTGSRIMRRQEEANAPIPVAVRPEPIEVRASVKVTYRLGR